jgi:hypothetical protein
MAPSATAWLLLAWGTSKAAARFVALTGVTPGEPPTDGLHSPSGLAACRAGIVQMVEWVEDDAATASYDLTTTATASGRKRTKATRRVARVFDALAALSWPCPVFFLSALSSLGHRRS